MRHVLLALAFASIPLGAGHGAAPEQNKGPVTIQMRNRVQMGNRVIRIRDVARLVGGDAVTRRRIGNLGLNELTESRRFCLVRAISIRTRCLLAGYDDAQFRITGAPECLADAGGAEQEVAEKERDPETLVVDAIRTELAGLWQTVPQRVSVRLTRPMSELDAIPEDVEILSVRVYPPADPVPGPVSVMAVIKTDGRPPLRSTVQVAARDDTPIDTTGRARLENFGSPIQLASAQQSSRSTNATPPRQRLPNRPFVVRPREVVRLVAVKGPLRVSIADAVTLEAGRVGDLIRLKNPKSGKTVMARLMSANEATIEL